MLNKWHHKCFFCAKMSQNTNNELYCAKDVSKIRTLKDLLPNFTGCPIISAHIQETPCINNSHWPVTIHTSLWLHCIALTGLSWACKIVSKLKVSPFHRVNSPLEAPVISLLPSGVQERQNIGHLILLVAVLTNLVVTALTGLSRRS